MIWNMRRRKKKVFTVTLSGRFNKSQTTTDRTVELYVTINGKDYTDEGVYEVAPNTVISIYAQNCTANGQTSAGTINLNGTKVNQSASYGLKITGNAVIKGTIGSPNVFMKTATADITMPA